MANNLYCFFGPPVLYFWDRNEEELRLRGSSRASDTRREVSCEKAEVLCEG